MRPTRRQALMSMAAPAVLVARPRVAITIDDVQWKSVPESAEPRLLEAMGKTRAMLFAIGEAVDNARGTAILQRWSEAGHWIGNHTWDHKPLNGRTTPEAFEESILRADALLARYSGFRKWFRFPVLKEGRTREERDHVRAFLARHGYRNGAVTIDASDWYYEWRLKDRLKKDSAFDTSRYRQPYLDHLWDRAQYYDRLARGVVGRSVAHTLLLHYNFINALFLGDVVAMFRAKGWGVVGADEAFAGDVFRRAPGNLPAGESLIWALAKESGKFEGRLRYPGEDGEYEKPLLDKLGL